MKTELRYLLHDPDKRGNDRYYVRKRGMRKIRIRQIFKDAEGTITPEFMADYRAAIARLNGGAVEQKPRGLREETFNWLFAQYYKSSMFAKLDPATQKDKRSVIDRFAAGAGELPYKKYRREDMEKSQQARKATPGAADKLVKVLCAVFNWAIAQKPPLMATNPAVGVEPINKRSGGFHTWTPDEIDKFRDHWPMGSKPRLAMELMIAIGARRSDAAQIGPRNEFTKDGVRWVRFKVHKGRNLYPVDMEARLTGELIEAIEKTEIGQSSYVTSSRNTPYTIESFGNAFSRWCEEAGLPHCSSHGLRKAAAVAYAESGATAPELMAVFGWSNLRTAQIYIEKAEQRRMRSNAFKRREEHEKGKSVPLSPPKKADETKGQKSNG